jgi:hypothetical protein
MGKTAEIVVGERPQGLSESVRFVENSIAGATGIALGSLNSGEVIGADSD